MARDGSGNYSLPSGQPVVTATTISSTVHNTFASDVAAALTASIAKDGQTVPTADLPMGTYKHTNVGSGSARTHYPSIGQLQDGGCSLVGSVAGTDTITGSLTPAITGYAGGMVVVFEPANTNTGAVTIALNGLAAKAIVKWDGDALIAGDLAANVPAVLVYDGSTNFILLNPNFPSTLPAVSGANLTALNATNLASGTVPDARFPATLPALSGANLTALNATNLASGTVPDARFPATLPALSGANLTALNASNLASGTVPDARLNANPPFTTIELGHASDTTLSRIAAGRVAIEGVEIGYKHVPQNAQDGNYTCVLSDAAKHIYKAAGGAGETITFPANASVAYDIGTVITIINQGGGNLTIAITSDAMEDSNGGVAPFTLGDNGRATAIKVTATAWHIDGSNLTGT